MGCQGVAPASRRGFVSLSIVFVNVLVATATAAEVPIEAERRLPPVAKEQPAGNYDESFFVPGRSESPGPVDVATAAEQMRQLRGQCGASLHVKDVTGSDSGAVWGTNFYTDDSDLATAAVHAGVLRKGEKGDIVVLILPGRESYTSSTRHGVTSGSYGSWHASYAVLPGGSSGGETDTPRSLPADWTQRIGEIFEIDVVGSQEGTIWGSTVYTNDSPIGVAAVHAGVLRPGQRGTVRVVVLPGRNHYEGSSRNGVTSHPYGSWSGSYFVEPPLSPPAPTNESGDLLGDWQLSLPAGFTYPATIEGDRTTASPRFRFKSKATNLNGVYEQRGKKLVAVEPTEPSFAGYTWQIIRPDLLVLTAESANPPGDYLGAILERNR